MRSGRKFQIMLRTDEPARNAVEAKLLELDVRTAVELAHALRQLEDHGPTIATRMEVLDVNFGLYVMPLGMTDQNVMLVEDIRAGKVWILGVEHSRMVASMLAEEGRQFLRLVNPAVER